MPRIAASDDSSITPRTPWTGADATTRACIPPQRAAIVSIVIPTLNEAHSLPATIAAAEHPDVELIVVDGGSTDETIEVAEALGARVVRSPRGRGPQLAAGAAFAAGKFLLFLHADAVLPADYLPGMLRAMVDPECVVGAFRLRIDGDGWVLRVIEWGARVRCGWLGLPYGDQGLFVRASVYRDLGGFLPLSSMEDLEFVRRAAKRGEVRTLEREVTVSARAWRQHGVLRFTCGNLVCSIALFAGVPPERVARWRSRFLARRRGR